MPRPGLFLFSLFLFLYGWALRPNHCTAKTDTLYVNEKGSITDNTDYTFYRIWKRKKKRKYVVSDFFRDHKLHMTGTYLDKEFTVREGHFVYYNEDGTKYSEGKYVNNLAEGEWITYNQPNENWPNMDNYAFYKHGVQEGMNRSLNRETGCIVTMGYTKGEKTNGQWVVFYGNGDTMMVENFENGMLNGYTKFFHSEPNEVVMEGLFYNDNKIGKWYYWWPKKPDTLLVVRYLDSAVQSIYCWKYDSVTHQLLSEGKYVNNLREGIWIDYFNSPKRQIYSKSGYVNDIWQGPYVKYDSLTGKINEEGNVVNEELDGIWKKYEDGIMIADVNYKAGLKQGYATFYYDNGKKYQEGLLADDIKTGLWKTYDKEGELTESAVLELGFFEGKRNFYKNNKVIRTEIYRRGALVEDSIKGRK